MSNPQRYPNGLRRDAIEAFAWRLRDYVEYINAEARSLGILPAAVYAIIYHESKGDHRARNRRSGARGMMQVLPRVHTWYGYSAAAMAQPTTQIQAGMRVFSSGLRRFEGEYLKAFMAYGAGAGWVLKWTAAHEPHDWEVYEMALGFVELLRAFHDDVHDPEGCLASYANARRRRTPDSAFGRLARVPARTPTALEALHQRTPESSFFSNAYDALADFLQ